MSLFCQELSHKHSSSEEKATELLEDYSMCYGRQKLAAKESPVLDATVCGLPAMSPLTDAGADDSANSLLLDKLHIYTDFEDALLSHLSAEPTSSYCLGSDDSVASSTEELSPNEVFVFNIKYSTTKPQLEAVFSRCGAVACITLPFDEMASRIKGYAFIAFERDESVKRAIEQMNGFYLNGRPLSVRRKTECKSSSARSQKPAQTLFVGNIPLEATRHQIRHLFSAACGNRLHSVRLVKTASGMPRGFGYVDFFSKEDATRALSLNGHVIYGKVLRVHQSEGYQPDFRKKKAMELKTRPLFADGLDTFQIAKATALRNCGCILEGTPPFIATVGALATAGFFPSAQVMADCTLVADASDCCRVRVPVPVAYFPLIQVPRDFYTLVPMQAASGSLMDAMCVGMAQLPVSGRLLLPPPDTGWAVDGCDSQQRVGHSTAYVPF